MLRTKNYVMGLAVAAPLFGVMLAAAPAPANANAYLYAYDTHSGSYLCQKSSSTDAGLSCSGSIGSWSFTVDSGIDGTSGSLGKIDLSFVSEGSAPPADHLDLLYFVDDVSASGGTKFKTTLGGTADPGTTGDFESAFYNAAFPTVPVSSFCGQTTGPDYGIGTIISTFCGQKGVFTDTSVSGGYTLTGTYELGLLADLNLNSGSSQIISGDFEVQVPEPGTLALFGAGLLGCALLLGRRRQPNV